MAETLVREPPAKAGNPELPGALEDISHIEMLCKVLGMDVNARNKLEVPDIDYLQGCIILSFLQPV